MAVFNKFDSFAEAVYEKVHNMGSDTLKCLLTNAAPVAGNTQKSNLTEIGTGNGYAAGGPQASQTSSAQSSGLYKLVCTDIVITASGGTIGPFRYVALYNDTATNKELIGYFDYGSSITLNNGETFTIDFDGSLGVLTHQ